MVKKVVENLTEVNILEVGCGTGNVLQALEKEFTSAHLIGMDLFQEGLQFARRRVNCGLVQADLAFPPFGKPFDLLGMFDVLEHIKDDRSVLSQAFEQIKPGGWLLITVPAEPKLWSYFDVASHHVRRYTREELEEKTLQAGFNIVFSSPYITATYPLVWLTRGSKGNSSGSDEQTIQNQAEEELKIIPVVNGIIRGILSLEAGWLAAGKKLPFGSSLVLLAQKPTI